MKSAVIVLGLVLLACSCCHAKKPYNKCYLGYEKVGCFKDSLRKRDLPHQLLNERDPSNPHYDGHKIDWKNYGKYLAGLACRCAAKAKELGYKYFGLQFYGECWAGNRSNRLHRPTHRCWQSRPGKKYPKLGCDSRDMHPCVGGAHVNYIYRVACRDKLSTRSCHYLKEVGQCRRQLVLTFCCKTCYTYK